MAEHEEMAEREETAEEIEAAERAQARILVLIKECREGRSACREGSVDD